jgi:hypothetical protein
VWPGHPYRSKTEASHAVLSASTAWPAHPAMHVRPGTLLVHADRWPSAAPHSQDH